MPYEVILLIFEDPEVDQMVVTFRVQIMPKLWLPVYTSVLHVPNHKVVHLNLGHLSYKPMHAGFQCSGSSFFEG